MYQNSKGVWYMCFVVWKYVWKYVWVKKYMKMHVMLFKNWKCVFEWVYQTLPQFFLQHASTSSTRVL